jgi:8-oxo-dGTP pyrophosphatase MutT (NUDIX family)
VFSAGIVSLVQRLTEALARQPSSALIAGDGMTVRPASLDTVAAAVLVAITDRPEPGVILTQRPDTMRKHPGQVAFPGGRVDPTDSDMIDAALREAQEEVAMPRNRVRIVGLADPYCTITGYEVTPVLGVIPADLTLIANEEEVAAIFEAPLAWLLDPTNHSEQEIDFQGSRRRFFEMHWDGFRIWGATAAMIVNLSRRLQWQA